MELYTDNAPEVGAREYVGCFTIASVRERLNQPPPSVHVSLSHRSRKEVVSHLRQAGVDPLEDPISVDSQQHHRQGCACSILHTYCDPTNQHEYTGEGAISAVLRSAHAPNTPSSEPPSKKQPSWWEMEMTVSLKDLGKAAKDGCWFCSIIYGGVKAFPGWIENGTVISIHPDSTVRVSWSGNPCFCYVTLSLTQKSRTIPSLSFNTEISTRETPRCKVFAPLSALPALFDYARKSIEECRASHDCTISNSGMLPTRLLDIRIREGRYSIKLVGTREEGMALTNTPYVALSYCWGKTVMPTTTASTIEQRKQDIPWSILTQTFRDAIALSHLLGYQYLWIDALCIIQGDRDDWLRESSQMNAVYGNCDLMLSADRAPDGQIGMLAQEVNTRSWEPLVSQESRHGVHARFNGIHRTFGVNRTMFSSEEEAMLINPVGRRGWCFQEQHMAPRILHFGLDEILYQCGRVAHCQCGQLRAARRGIHTGKMRFHQLYVNGCTVEDKISFWLNIVWNYSERLLTDWTDRLPAISGLAKQFMPAEKLGTTSVLSNNTEKLPFSEINLGRYLAGLWSNCLMQGLCWYADFTPGGRITPYVAPSWTWAAVTGSVNFAISADTTAVQIHSADCTLSGSDPTGSVRSGQVVMTASIIPLVLHSKNLRLSSSVRRSCYFIQMRGPPSETQAGIDCRLDAPLNPPPDYPLSMFMNPDIPREDVKLLDDGIYGVRMSDSFILLLKPTASLDRGEYERIGSITPRDPEKDVVKGFFGSASKRKLTII